MAEHSSIDWTDSTWNPVTGCTKVSLGCKNCYAERLALRLQRMGNPRYRNGFRPTLHEDLLTLPIKWRERRLVFVNSMSDLFHEDVPFEFIESVFSNIARAHWHTFQVLTKRASRLEELAPLLHWPQNLWVGVSIEHQDYVDRAKSLRNVEAATRFLSCEPLLGPLQINLDGITWVIAGGESGPHARPMDLEWARTLRDQCSTAGIPYFLKQLGGASDKRSSQKAILDGQVWRAMPALT